MRVENHEKVKNIAACEISDDEEEDEVEDDEADDGSCPTYLLVSVMSKIHVSVNKKSIIFFLIIRLS